jgi:hypothetical protein
VNLTKRTDGYWDRFIAECHHLKAGAPLYAALAGSIKHDEELCALAAEAWDDQPMANILFGAVHYLLLRGTEHPLRAYYRTLGGNPSNGEPFPAFRDFCVTHRDALRRQIRTRVTNTNEVGRSAILNAAFLELAKSVTEPLHLIEIGPSAGLNLYWDRYHYKYRWEGEELISGANDSDLVLEMPVSGSRPPSGNPPRVGTRVGLERTPVDLNDAEDRDWLRALIWPDHPDRLARLEKAIAAVRSFHPDIRPGDALRLLIDAIASAPREGALCVFHTMATYQFYEEDRAALDAILTVAGMRRRVWRLSMEWESDIYPLRLHRYAGGTREDLVLATCDSHGSEMHWQP